MYLGKPNFYLTSGLVSFSTLKAGLFKLQQMWKIHWFTVASEEGINRAFPQKNFKEIFTTMKGYAYISFVRNLSLFLSPSLFLKKKKKVDMLHVSQFWVHVDTAAGVSEWLGGTKHLWEANPENAFPCLYLGLTLLESMTTQRQPIEGVHPKRRLSPYFQWGCMFSYECLAFLSHCWRMLGNRPRHGASCLESCSREAEVPPRMCL